MGIRNKSAVDLEITPRGRMARQVVPRLFGLTLGFIALGCSMTPQGAERGRRQDDADKLAQASAYAGRDKKDGFVVPKARGLHEPAATLQKAASTKAKASDIKLGLATITFGAQLPYLAPKTGPFASVSEQAPAVAPETSSPKSTWRLLRTLRVGEGYLYKAEFTPDGKQVVTLSTDSGTIYYFDVTSGKLISKIKLPDFTQFEDADFAIITELPDRPQLVISRESGASILDLMSGKFDPLDEIPAGNGVNHSNVYGLYGTTMRHINPQSGTLDLYWLTGERSLHANCNERPDMWELSSDGKWLVMSYYPSQNTEVIDLEAREVVLTLANPKWETALALSPNKELLALGGEQLALVKTNTGSLIAEDATYGGNLSGAAFTPSGDLLIVSAYDSKIRSYALDREALESGKLPAPQLLSHQKGTNVYQVALSSDGRKMVSPSGDQTLKIWTR